MKFALKDFHLRSFVAATLSEDLGPTGRDITSESVIPSDVHFAGVMDSRDPIVVAGLPIAAAFFKYLDSNMKIDILAAEGQHVAAGTDLMWLKGRARAMLTAIVAIPERCWTVFNAERSAVSMARARPLSHIRSVPAATC